MWLRLRCTAAGESARIREALSSALSPVKLGVDAALSAPSYERRHAVGTPDYLAPELLLGETCTTSLRS